MRSLINFMVGVVLGVIGVFMYTYSKFLYFTVFVPQALIWYIIINFSVNKKRLCRK